MSKNSEYKKYPAGYAPDSSKLDKNNNSANTRRSRQVELALIISALIFSMIFRYIFWQRREPLSITDMAFYVDIAQKIQALDFSGIIHFHYGCLYPFFILVLHGISGLEWGVAARWVNIISGALTMVPLYIIAKHIFNKRTAWFTLILSSLAWADISSVGYAESPFGLFAYLAFMLVVVAWKRQGWWFIIAGAVVALSSLVKSEGTLFWALIFLIYLAKTFRNWRTQVPYYAGYLLVYLVIISPYMITYYQETGRLSLNPKSRTLFFVHNQDYSHFLYDLREDERGYYTNAARIYLEGDRDPVPISLYKYIKGDLAGLAGKYFDRLVFNFTEMIPYLCYLILPPPIRRVTPVLDRLVPILASLILVFAFIRTRRDYSRIRREVPLYFILAAGLAAVAIYNPWVRFFYSIFPALIIIYAKGIDQVLFWLEKGMAAIPVNNFQRHQKATGISAALLIASVVLWFHFHHLYQAHPNPEVVRDFRTKDEIVRWLKPRIKKHDRIMGYGLPNRVVYFLGMPPEAEIILPITSIDQAVQYARQEGVKYLIVESDEVGWVFEDYGPLFNPEFSHPALKRETIWMVSGDEAFVIYSIVYENEKVEGT
jgi:hypothetical protein